MMFNSLEKNDFNIRRDYRLVFLCLLLLFKMSSGAVSWAQFTMYNWTFRGVQEQVAVHTLRECMASCLSLHPRCAGLAFDPSLVRTLFNDELHKLFTEFHS